MYHIISWIIFSTGKQLSSLFSILNGISVGDEIDVAYNVESRDFNGKWYHNINAWKISPVKQETNSSSYQGNNAPPPPEPNFQNEGPAYDDLPF